MSMESTVSFELNGRKVVSSAQPEERLIDVLRDEFGCMGVKLACGEGECGACTVLLDGRVVLSCIMAVGAVQGCSIITIEGLKDTAGFEILTQAFNDAGAVQCGFCTPGMLMSAYALLAETPDPAVNDIKTALSGNLCRCTGYNMIIEAVGLAAGRRGEQW